MASTQREALLLREFRALYGAEPEIWVRAPGRVDLMGSHTDYNEGFVLAQAIDRDTWLAAKPRPDSRVRIASLNSQGQYAFDLTEVRPASPRAWCDYVKGVADVLLKEGYPLQGFDGLLHSTVPFGSGLSSSAALEVAAALAFDQLGDLRIDPLRMAMLCQRAENEFVGMRCGILDQYTSLMGGAGQVILLDCRSLSSQSSPIAAGIQTVICDTRAVRQLTGSEYPERRRQCEQGAHLLAKVYPEVKTLRDASLEQLEAQAARLPEVVVRRCRFIIQENRRVIDMAAALQKGDLEQVGALASQSYRGARDLFEISCPEMEQMYAAMTSAVGVIGARQAGAGFGGCMVAFVRPAELDTFCKQVVSAYQASSGIEPWVYPVSAAAGAGRLF